MVATATNNGTTTCTQADRLLKVVPPSGVSPDALLLVGFLGQEGLSRPFRFYLDLIAENRTVIAFEKYLGQPVTVEMAVPGSKTPRYFNGICCRLSQGERDNEFTPYRMELVPKL